MIRHSTNSRHQRGGIFGLAVVLTLATTLLGCGGTPAPQPVIPAPNPVPAERVDSSDPARAADPSAAVQRSASRYAQAAEYSSERGGLALVIVEGTQTVLATGQNGRQLETAHPLYNASESFWCPAAIAAEIDGLLDLDEPVSFTIESFDANPWKRAMRLRELLQYTSGLESGVLPLSRELPANRYARALALEMVAQPGERFQFGPSHLAVFGEVLRRKLMSRGLDPVTYLQLRIFEPIGLELAAWTRDEAGNPDLSGGAQLSAAEWAKYGVFVRDRGLWKSKPILGPTTLAACFVGSQAEPRFGLSFWLNPTDPETTSSSQGGLGSFYRDGLEDLVVAAGAGNQRLYVIPSLDLVVARLGDPGHSWRDSEFLNLLVAARRSPQGESTVVP